MEVIAGGVKEARQPIFRDIRRYYCEYCGLCRSKKSLIASHIISHHQDETEEGGDDKEEKEQKQDASKSSNSNTCEECGASFRKPAYLKQHMLTHSGEDGCSEVYENTHYKRILYWREALDPTERTPKCTRQRKLA